MEPKPPEGRRIGPLLLAIIALAAALMTWVALPFGTSRAKRDAGVQQVQVQQAP